MEISERLADYFVVVGLGSVPTLRDVHQSSIPFLRRTYASQIVDRFPLKDYKESPCPPGIALFCVPGGLQLTTKLDLPKIHFFAATHGDGKRLYGTCLRFYEPVTPEVRQQLLRACYRSDETPRSTEPEDSEADAMPSHDTSVSDLSASGHLPAPPRLVQSSDESVPQIVVSPSTPVHSSSSPSTETNGHRASGMISTPDWKQSALHRRASFSEMKHDEDPNTAVLYAPKCICVLSHFPFFDGFRTFLTSLYRLSLTPLTVPLERFISNFMLEVPLPPPGQWKVQYHIGPNTITFCRPPANNPLLFPNFPIRSLFEYLSIENVELLLSCVLMEYQVLLLSSQYSLLSMVAETILALIYPFQWIHTYIPLLPRSLVDFLNAPFPFLIGCPTSFVNRSALSPDIAVFDLDNNEVVCRNKPPLFPMKEHNKLMKALAPLTKLFLDERRRPYALANKDYAFHSAPPPDEVDANYDDEQIKIEEAEVQAAFFRVFVSVFKNYRDYLIFPSQKDPHPSSCFNADDFIKTQSSSSAPFFTQFLKTQAWQTFVERRTYPSRVDHDVQFFDESIVAKKNRSKFVKTKSTPFLNDPTHFITKTHVAPSPDATSLDPVGYKYGDCWPKLNISLFLHVPRYVTPLGNVSQSSKREPRRAQDYMTSPASVLYSIWFIVFTAIVNQKSKADRLDDAFDVLRRMRQEHVQPEDFIFRLLIDACGNCGQPARAEHVLHAMEDAGYPPNASTYAALLQVFFLNGDGAVGYQLLESFKRSRLLKTSSLSSLAEAVDEVKRNLSVRSGIGMGTSTTRSAAGSSNKSTSSNPANYNTVKKGALFEFVFPGLAVNTGDSCPECGRQMNDREIRQGWTRDSNDYTTKCTDCGERFVARFAVKPVRVTSENFGEVTCEYLPPLVLKKEIEALLEQKDGQYLCTPEFRQRSPTCFWNLAWHLTGMNLPLHFLFSEGDHPIRLTATNELFVPPSPSGSAHVNLGTAFDSALQDSSAGSLPLSGGGVSHSSSGITDGEMKVASSNDMTDSYSGPVHRTTITAPPRSSPAPSNRGLPKYPVLHSPVLGDVAPLDAHGQQSDTDPNGGHQRVPTGFPIRHDSFANSQPPQPVTAPAAPEPTQPIVITLHDPPRRAADAGITLPPVGQTNSPDALSARSASSSDAEFQTPPST